MKKSISMVLAIFLVFAAVLAGCNNAPAEVSKPEWETKEESTGNLSYQVPADWVITEDVTGQGGIIYIPSDADVNAGSSNVNLVVQETTDKAVPLKDMQDAFSTQFEQQLLAQGADAVTNIKTDSFTAPIGDVYVISYELSLAGMTFKQTQYYPLMDNYIVVITATDIEDDIDPEVVSVAEYLTKTLTLKK